MRSLLESAPPKPLASDRTAAVIGAKLRNMAATSGLALPQPGDGDTIGRWSALAALGRQVAFDPVPIAVQRARAETTGLSHVDIRVGAMPAALPAQPVDLLVYSEILSYLGDEELTETIERSVTALRRGGQVLAVHWRHRAPEAPRDVWDVHRRLLGHEALDCLVEHVDEEFVLPVLRRR
jgi:hypothetical protein